MTARRGKATIVNGTIDGSVVGDQNRFEGDNLTLSRRVHVTGGVYTTPFGYLALSHVVLDGGIQRRSTVSVHDSVVHGSIVTADVDQSIGVDIVGNTIYGSIIVFQSIAIDRVFGTIADNTIRGGGIEITGGSIALWARCPSSATRSPHAVGDGIRFVQSRPVFGVPVPPGQFTITARGAAQRWARDQHRGSDAGDELWSRRRWWQPGQRQRIDPQCVQIRCGPPDGRVPTITWAAVPNLAVGLGRTGPSRPPWRRCRGPSPTSSPPGACSGPPASTRSRCTSCPTTRPTIGPPTRPPGCWSSDRFGSRSSAVPVPPAERAASLEGQVPRFFGMRSSGVGSLVGGGRGLDSRGWTSPRARVRMSVRVAGRTTSGSTAGGDGRPRSRRTERGSMPTAADAITA